MNENAADVEIRFYEHPETQATRWVGGTLNTELSVLAHGWDYEDGDMIQIGPEWDTLVWVGSRIHTDDSRGNYIVGKI